jgi:hypothetical protein
MTAATQKSRQFKAARRALIALLLTIVTAIGAGAFGLATFCVTASTGVGGFHPMMVLAKCDAFLSGVAALMTPVIGVIATYVAYQQHRTARTTLRLHLYERRVEILRGVLGLWAACSAKAKYRARRSPSCCAPPARRTISSEKAQPLKPRYRLARGKQPGLRRSILIGAGRRRASCTSRLRSGSGLRVCASWW